MNPAFLVLANLCLFTRLLCLFRDDVAEARVWRIKTLVEVGVATALFPFGGMWLVVVLTLAAFNLAGFRAERRGRRKDLARLLLGAAELAMLSVWLSPRLGLEFCPGFSTRNRATRTLDRAHAGARPAGQCAFPAGAFRSSAGGERIESRHSRGI
ncbi:MAG: hypothetical protein WDM96_03055 [Lacunisphaera sp.]